MWLPGEIMRRGLIVLLLVGLGAPFLVLFLLLYLALAVHLITVYMLVPGIILSLILVPLTMYYLINMPITVSINLNNREVIVKTLRGIRRYAYVNISCVDINEYLKWRVCGIGLPGLAVGIFTNVDDEDVHVYTDTRLSLLVETIDGKKYLFSLPKDLENHLCRE